VTTVHYIVEEVDIINHLILLGESLNYFKNSSCHVVTLFRRRFRIDNAFRSVICVFSSFVFVLVIHTPVILSSFLLYSYTTFFTISLLLLFLLLSSSSIVLFPALSANVYSFLLSLSSSNALSLLPAEVITKIR